MGATTTLVTVREFLELPEQIGETIELATGLANINAEDREHLESNGWRLRDAHAFTTDPWKYRNYVQTSRGEFTVAKDLNVRLRSGWFSERSACYLAAGRPVVTQDTGFGNFFPTGEGLFSFNTPEEIVAHLRGPSGAPPGYQLNRVILCSYWHFGLLTLDIPHGRRFLTGDNATGKSTALVAAMLTLDGDVRPHRNLTAKAVAFDLFSAQSEPEAYFSIGHLLPEPAGTLNIGA